ncbi:MAG: AAA family ATPase, partial [Desulfobulbales bacterium]|nr:AAA family ATPase [Desulfobulbales bacterium]
MSTPYPMHKLRDLLADRELFSSLDRHFAMFIGRLARKHDTETALAAAFVSSATKAGNICLDLNDIAGMPLHGPCRETGQHSMVCPGFPEWLERLSESGVVSDGGEDTPLVLAQSGKLYLRRYWDYEKSIIRFLSERSGQFQEDVNCAQLGRNLQELFQPDVGGETDWQQVAAISAVSRSFCVISGGPGTGKTSTVAKILALLQGQQDNRRLRILLGAPTGKAASRLQQAIDATGLVQNDFPSLQATTVHRMLGHVPHSPYFRHNARNPLTADVVVIDEASMVDLPLMAKLMQAVPDTARLILLGDRHQLASVQPGSVLGDLCCSGIMSCFSGPFSRLVAELTGTTIPPGHHIPATGVSSLLQDSFVELRQSYRFAA